MNAAEFTIVPLVPWPVIAGLAGPMALALGFAAVRRARGTALRAAAALVLLAALVNPSVVLEERQAQPDVAVVIVDDSESQAIGARAAQAGAVLGHVQAEIKRHANLELRVIEAGRSAPGAEREGTRLFDRLAQTLADVPRRRLAGVIAITDGQVHDRDEAQALNLLAPFHVLLTGERGEADRRLVVAEPPSYALVGRPVPLTFRVEDPGAERLRRVHVTIRRDGEERETMEVLANQDHRIELALDRAGPSVIEIEAEPGERELTLANNRAVLALNGVRDRLRVLLVSGEPHPGERAWRKLLKSDPAVDLVHFTILRPPEKQDRTPVHELSLITLPVRELFEQKLGEFDLVIFDHYRRRGILPIGYFANVARYVENGGALLLTVGPFFATPMSLYNTPLGDILPGQPTGKLIERGFRPALTELGGRHPVTSALPTTARDGVPWGRWFRQVEATARRGHVLMEGADSRPLLILDRQGKGRVGQILSDQIWLWARGFEDGGPQAELLRRLAHWLMKEPDLEEDTLAAAVRGDQLEIARRSLDRATPPVTVTTPSGKTERVALAAEDGGRATASLTVRELGLYRATDGRRTALAVAGPPNPLELADVRATDERLAPIAEATGGGVLWLSDGPPEIRRVRPGRDASGTAGRRGWIGLRVNEDYVVAGLERVPLLPALAVMLVALSALAFAWRREGR